MHKKNLKFLPSLLQKTYARILRNSYPRYQPVTFAGKTYGGNDRVTSERWEIMKKWIPRECRVLDLGCAEGFFVFSSAKELGCLSLGIDRDIRRIALASEALVAEEVQDVSFMHSIIDTKLIKKLPSFDIILFMSVFHHMIVEKGLEESRSFLSLLRKITGVALIFETGQSNEKISRAQLLPDMGENPVQWITDLLLSCGWSKVEKIGESDAYYKDIKRALFIAYP